MKSIINKLFYYDMIKKVDDIIEKLESIDLHLFEKQWSQELKS